MKRLLLTVLATSLATPVWLPAQLILNPNPSRMIGQTRLTFTGDQANLVEGRGLNGPQSVAIDTTSTPPAIYVADTNNSRVLGWKDAANFSNGAEADIVIGQRDKYSSLALGPGTTLSSGLRAPTGVAVDNSGRLFVLDAGNNRILRYPNPFAQPDDLKMPDLVIGQNSLTTNSVNQGGQVSAKSLAFYSGSVYTSSLAFDAQGNLWVTDALNHRVLRYPASRIGDGATNGPEADLVLGQTDFATNTGLSVTSTNRLNKSKLNAPSGLAFDRAGRLFVADGLSRVLVYAANPVTGIDASRIMGIAVTVTGQPAPTTVNDTGLNQPQGIVVINNTPLVMDSRNHRIVRYDPVDLWDNETAEKPSPSARAVIGQDSLSSTTAAAANRGKGEPGNNTLSLPVQAVYYNGETYVVDYGNNRVLVFPDLSTGPVASASAPYEAKRVLGQLGFSYNATNLIEGREVFRAQGLAVDSTSSPPIVYIADTLNNRILGYRDSRKLRPGDSADLVIGQPDFYRSVPNYPANSTTQMSASSLLTPTALAVDSEGNLWVADTGNGRVLRFPRPFDRREPLQPADLVIGQSDFTIKNTDATARTMAGPAGIAFTPDGHLLVSDLAHNRVLYFRKPFTNGMAATAVFGQPDFFTVSAGSDLNRLSAPRHISTDTDGRFYVADSGNRRVAIYSNPAYATTDPSAAFTLPNLSTPIAVTVNQLTGEIWVGESGSNRALRFPRYDSLITGGTTATATITMQATGVAVLAIALDGNNLLLSDWASRVSVYFPGLTATNAANGLQRLSPGMYATLRPVTGASFGDQTQVFNEVAFPPMTRTLGDIQVLVNDAPTPLHYVSPNQINVLLPMSAPTSGTIEIQVIRASTGQILASYPVRMEVASPGLFTSTGGITGQLAALNQDNTVNSASNPVQRGQIIQLFGTGQGFITRAPADGEPPGGAVSTDVLPRIIMGTDFVADSDIQYSGLAPGAVGLWQINVRVPEKVAPGNAVLVVVVMRDIPSNNPQAPSQIRTTIAVKQ